MGVQGSCEWRDESERFGRMILPASQGKTELNPYTCLETPDTVTPIGVVNMMEKQSVPRPKPSLCSYCVSWPQYFVGLACASIRMHV